MESKFFNWYTQSLGGTFGIISCICAYLNGYMFVYTNSASKYFESIGFLGIISSYTLLPLCMLTLIFGVIYSYTPETSDKSIFNIPFFTLNKRLIPREFLRQIPILCNLDFAFFQISIILYL